ncbi:hypothetical protein Glove_13g297 [Diversispora epigaea]|uniref:Endonuclease/exonuclease/phosphatase domain-containing protein n=1 Tax=Diversispora epigaea TaxID=1348612 RepID=A0A397JMU9_9GLOM|nr:hypothetical protein Glove_13g297 [Diversispora epigaea]
MEENTKKSGHGVAITLKKNIALHTFKKKELKGYALQLLLSFKGKYIIQLITIYNPPQTTENASIRMKLKNWLIETLNEGKSKNWHTIMGGDWNITLHPEFDRKTTQETTNASTNKRKPRSSILNHVKYMDYIDAYEITNNNKEKTEEKNLTCIKTNEHYTAMSRIDAFWVDKEVAEKIIKFKTLDTTNQFLTDHKMVTIKIDPSEWTDRKYILWVKNANQRKKKLWDTKNTEQTQ